MPENEQNSPLNRALRAFEAAEANVEKLERVFQEIAKLTPAGIEFGSDPRYEERVRAYSDLLLALPAIDGFKPTIIPWDRDAIAQARLDAKEIGEFSAELSVEHGVEAPGKELAEYRHKLNRKRRQLIRSAVGEALAEVDSILRALRSEIEGRAPNETVQNESWGELQRQVQVIDTLLGSAIPRPSRWSDLRRHLSFGMVQDLSDIVRMDWPSVKSGLERNLYAEDEPIPVEVSDLGALVAEQPSGPIATELKWEQLDEERFERLIFALIASTPGYENPEWLMRTNAPDRGRDLSVWRVFTDRLTGVMRQRVIIQCKHWLSKSISVAEVATLKEQVALWEPPKVDVLVIATTGRFTADAVATVERHNHGNSGVRIEMWPESHLERLLAERPSLIAEFRLR